MQDSQLAEDLARRLGALLPAQLGEARISLQARFQAELRLGLRQQGQVTREEFELQRALLLRTRARLEALELELALARRMEAPSA